jgi:hypothetical protein
LTPSRTQFKEAGVDHSALVNGARAAIEDTVRVLNVILL